jgi:hypothetical protein
MPIVEEIGCAKNSEVSTRRGGKEASSDIYALLGAKSIGEPYVRVAAIDVVITEGN